MLFAASKPVWKKVCYSQRLASAWIVLVEYIYSRNVSAEWGGIDTLIITAGVSTVRFFMDNVSLGPGSSDSSTESARLCHAKSIAQRALDANLFAPLISAAAFVRCMIHSVNLSLTPKRARADSTHAIKLQQSINPSSLFRCRSNTRPN